MDLTRILTRSELAWLATLNPEPLTHAEFVAHNWARQQMLEVKRRAEVAREAAIAKAAAEDRLLAARQRASPCPGQFLTRDMVIEARRAAGSLSPTYRGRMMRTRSD